MALLGRRGTLQSLDAQVPASWNEFITTVLIDSGYVTKGAVYSTEARRWASSKGFDMTGEELKTIIHGFVDPVKLWRDGVKVGGQVFTCTRSETGLVVGRESTGGTGCVIFRCNKCIVIAVHGEGVLPGGCYNLVLKLGEYLKQQGF